MPDAASAIKPGGAVKRTARRLLAEPGNRTFRKMMQPSAHGPSN
jgi:hypothetical protein